ncbi:MAG: lysine biosynthesis protein LysX [Thermoplasmata archaeon]
MSDAPRLGLFYTILRPEEKWLLAAASARGCPLVPMHDEGMRFPLEAPPDRPEVVLNRSVSHIRGLYASRFFEQWGCRTVNPAEVVERAGDKILGSLALARAGVPTPRTIVAFTEEGALRALEEIGYPAVLKPPVGSWGRLIARVHDREEAEQILEHKSALPSPTQSVFYVQEHVPKPERDLRVFVVGESVVAAMARRSADWRTNAARGATTEAIAPTPELTEIALRAARAMGGGVLAVDAMEGPGGLVVHEVNPTPEFRALTTVTGVDIAGRIVAHALEVAAR